MSRSFTYKDLHSALHKAVQKIQSYDGIPDDLFILKPKPSAWSADEVCRHLVRFNSLYIKQIDHAVQQLEKKPEAVGAFKTGFVQNLFIKFMEPPYKIKMNTLAPMHPAEFSLQPQEVRSQLARTNQELQGRILQYQASNLDLCRVKGRNPILKFLPMSVLDFILYLDAHQRRHFWQIEQTLKTLSPGD